LGFSGSSPLPLTGDDDFLDQPLILSKYLLTLLFSILLLPFTVCLRSLSIFGVIALRTHHPPTGGQVLALKAAVSDESASVALCGRSFNIGDLGCLGAGSMPSVGFNSMVALPFPT
jgi:hypothetical protein